MAGYCIVPLGGTPGNSLNKNPEATCSEWSSLPNKSKYEVVAVGLGLGDVLHRYSPEETEAMAYQFRHPRIRN